MDVYLYYGEGNFDKFQARNFGGESKGDWKLELKGKSAAQGKIQGKVLRDLISNIVSGSVPKEADWNKCTGNEYDKRSLIFLRNIMQKVLMKKLPWSLLQMQSKHGSILSYLV